MRFLTLLIILLSFSVVNAQSSFWSDFNPISRDAARIKTVKSKFYHLDLKRLENELKRSNSEFSRGFNKTIIDLPLNNGIIEQFEVYQTNTLDPKLQLKYPGINNYIIKSVNNDRIHGRIDVTYQGFHAMIRNEKSLVFIDPAFDDNTIDYMVYDKKDLIIDEKFECHVNSAHPETNSFPDSRVTDNNLRTYRMAISCTGEYARFHGGTVEKTLSAMNTTINRINFVYEHDFAVRFIIVPNTDLLIYTDPSNDPYDNNDIGAQLDENQFQCDSKIGQNNYDIGHIFSTGGGGLAGYAVACKNGVKAIGGTGSGSPVNDGFDIDYVAHEVGHQMSGAHTQNNNCNRDGSASYEPGSASTIMGYAGICDPNVQGNSDAYFHGYSLKEMGQYIVNGEGNSCPEKTILPGAAPVINSSSGNFTIPKLTPFELTASASGSNPVNYNWEQYDKEVAEIQPPSQNNKLGPMFRSYFADTSGTRTFPGIDHIVKNTTNIWETLPAAARNLNFVVTVREDVAGGARHTQKNNRLIVDATKGPFRVLTPNVPNITWFSNTIQKITWDVSGTDQSPINCNEVKIMLSEDGGYTYPHTLLITENDGDEDITVPEIYGNQMRIKVAANENVFFDISNNNFEIKEGLPPYTIDTIFSEYTLCQKDTTEFYVSSTDLDGISDTILVSKIGNVSGIEIFFSSDTLFTGDSVLVTVINNNASQGSKALTLRFHSDRLTIIRTFSISSVALPTVSTLSAPPNFFENFSPGQTLTWTPVTNQTVTYELQLSTDENFDNIVTTISGLTTNAAVLNTELENQTIYFWRVRAEGQCGFSLYSNSFLFRTGTCLQVYSSPFMTTPFTSGIVSDTIFTSDLPFETISEINLTGIRGYVENVEDITATFTNNDGVSAMLWNQSCSGNRDMDLSFNDNSSTIEIPCDVNPATLGLGNLAIKPLEPLSVFNGTDANTSFSIVIEDKDPGNGGSLEQWGINICGANEVCAPMRIPTSTRIYTADNMCTDGEGWTHYSISADKNPLGKYELMLLSLKLNIDDEVLPEEVRLRIPSSARYIKIPTAEYVNDASNWTVLSKHWLIDPAVQPSGSVGVRFYLSDVEMNALLDITGLSGQTDSLKVFSIFSNGVLNPNPIDNHVDIKPSDVKVHQATLNDYNVSNYLEFTVDHLSDGCVGAGGTFKASSKTTNIIDDLIVNIFPNPATNLIYIKTKVKEDLDFAIYDILGNVIKTGKMIQSEKSEINVQHLNAGTYIMKIKTSDGTGIKKFEILK